MNETKLMEVCSEFIEFVDVFQMGAFRLSHSSQWSSALLLIISLLIGAGSVGSGWGEVKKRFPVNVIRYVAYVFVAFVGSPLVTGVAFILIVIVASYAAAFIIEIPFQNLTDRWLLLASAYRSQFVSGVGSGLIIGVPSWLVVRRYLQPRTMRFLGAGVDDDDALTDVRTIQGHIPKPHVFDPRKYFAKAEKSNQMFFGEDQDGKTVMIPRERCKKSHIQIVGPTGTGKGVMACNYLVQGIKLGDGVFVIDPKNDEFAPSVLKQACDAEGKEFNLIDIRRGLPAQLDLLKGISSEDLNSLFIAGFGLGSKGTDADFYRKNDRAAARHLSRLADRGSVSFAHLAEQAGSELPEDLVDKCEGFRRSLEEIAELDAVQAPAGSIASELDGPINRGGCLYIVGSMDDEAVVVLQKMLLLRIVQIISARPRDGRQRHVTIFADEIRYLMSKKLGDVLGSVRDKGCNLILAHQSLDDLKAGDVPSPSVVIDNTAIRLLFRSTTPEMAQWIAGQTGKILVNTSRQIVGRNVVGGQVGDSEMHMSQAERQKVDVNMVQHLPDGVAVVIGAGSARLAFSAPVPVENKIDTAQLVVPATISAAKSDLSPAQMTDAGHVKSDDLFTGFLEDEESVG